MDRVMDFDQQPREDEADPLENTELARRLRRMDWPAAPTDVKQRCLDEILSRVSTGDDEPPQ